MKLNLSRLLGYTKNLLRWLKPGLGVKRWLILVLAGTTLLATGFALFVLDIYRTVPNTWWLPALSWISLRALPRLLRVVIFGSLGIAIVSSGIIGLNRAILQPFRTPGQDVVGKLQTHRQRRDGPRIVVIGGGHGLAMLLRGLKEYTHKLTAVVTVADDGGSSGRLRESLGILPPGDIRNCLAALSNDEALLTQLFQYRFARESKELEGHSFGNLFLSALAEITGSMEGAIVESGRLLAVFGRVLPSSLQDVRLSADIVPPHAHQEVRIVGESRIPTIGGNIRRVWLEPNDPPAFPKAIQAILAADFIVVGPGSLYTSLLPNLLIPDIANAMRASSAFKTYVCNVATQPGETDGFSCEDHLRVLDEHTGGGIFDLIVQNRHFEGKLPNAVEWVKIKDENAIQYPVYLADLINSSEPWHHDEKKLAFVLMALLQERTGPLGE
ncbi:MAG: YvcK family protein [Anaerolineae bacterium]|nr:YvcK family protein [Anaerolineae bacterium]